MNKLQLIKQTRSFLKQRRVIFFIKYPNIQKQQLIINAEYNLSVLEGLPEALFLNKCKVYGRLYISTLIPSKQSCYYEGATKLLEKFIN